MSEERKLVTVLFADVTGSTALGDELDPEDLRLLMSRSMPVRSLARTVAPWRSSSATR
jgi:class 3 adenylate cyclase